MRAIRPFVRNPKRKPATFRKTRKPKIDRQPFHAPFKSAVLNEICAEMQMPAIAKIQKRGFIKFSIEKR